jgi:hypothetical protein
VKEMLAACKSDDASIRKERCDRVIGSWFGAVMMAVTSPSRGPKPCIPMTNDVMETLAMFKEAHLKWLREHPETQDLSALDALLKATRALYTCPENHSQP